MPRQAESRWSWARRRGYAVLRATGIVGILALGTWAPAAGQEGAEARVTADRLNFREECGMSSPVLGVLTRDETVTVLGSELGTWIRVRNADGAEGCVSAQYLEIEAAGAVEAEAMASPSEESSPYAWADLTDSDSAEIVSEIEEFERELAATSDAEEQEDLRQEIAELENDLRVRQEELVEEREEAAREAREAEIVAQEETTEREAREAQRDEPRASGGSDWTGFYLGVNAGYGFGDEAETVLVFPDGSRRRSEEGDIDGVDGGVQVGYSHQFGRFVLGGEADFQLSNQNGSASLASIGFPRSSFELEYESFGTVRVRAGFSINRVLLYGTGGYAYAEVEDRFTGQLAEVLPPRSVSLDGVAIGAGVETRLAGRLSLKGEVLSFEFDDEPDFEGSEFFSARVGLNWWF